MTPLIPHTNSRILVATVVALLLAGCGGGGGGDSSSTASATPSAPATATTTTTAPTPSTQCSAVARPTSPNPISSAVVSQAYTYMLDRYFWNDRIPTAASGFNPATYSSIEALLDAVRCEPTDRYSFVTTVGPATALFDDGTSVGFGIGLLRNDARALFIEFVEPNSPAERAGFQRGDEIVAINDISVPDLDANVGGGFTGQGIGTGAANVTARFSLRHGTPATTRVVTATSATYTLKTVWAARVISPTEGYLSVKSFLSPTRTELRNTLFAPEWAGVTDIVLDLRYNGGGLVSVANDLTSILLGTAYNGRTFARLEYNSNNGFLNQTFALANPRSPSLAIRRVVILATPRTCSAAEEVVVALRSFVTTSIIASESEDGRYTCGKPYGFLPQAFELTPGAPSPNDPLLYAVNFRSVAADGTTDYVNGLPPTCTTRDDLTQPLASAGDRMYAAGLTRLRTGACAPVTTDRVRPLAFERSPRPWLPSGLGQIHGTW